MSPVTHFLTGWAIANAGQFNRRERTVITLAAVVPDIDGLGIIPELLTRNSSHPLLWFSQYHHSLHTLTFALVITIAAWFLSAPAGCTVDLKLLKLARSRSAITAFLAFLSFHLHLFCDLLGSRGPDGYSWPIPYLAPFSTK